MDFRPDQKTVIGILEAVMPVKTNKTKMPYVSQELASSKIITKKKSMRIFVRGSSLLMTESVEKKRPKMLFIDSLDQSINRQRRRL
ncbi:hypothetical protein OAL24_01294 [Oenococcus sicerae]|nr:hypothetical protein OAL24_01294 [Oenococcus sicerae]